MFQTYPNKSKKSSKNYGSSTESDDNNYNDRDAGQAVIHKNMRNRLQRIADDTKEELDKVLKRIDSTLYSYESSVKSSLVQHGATQKEIANVEYVADIKELENILNDSVAKQRYKQRVMVFIVGHTEQANEKSKLLEQISEFFIEQKHSFRSKEFHDATFVTETHQEVEQTLKSFDVKDCYAHVKELSLRLTELNEEMIEYLLQNAGTKQQAKGKKKLAQVAKEAKEQLAALQSKLDQCNTEMKNKDDRIESLEKEVDIVRSEVKRNQINQKKLKDQISQYETDVESYKSRIDELENELEQYRNQLNDLTQPTPDTHGSEPQDANNEENKNLDNNDESSKTIIEQQIDNLEEQSTTNSDKGVQTFDYVNETLHHIEQTLSNNAEEIPDLNILLNSTDEIDFNNVTPENLLSTFNNLRKLTTVRIIELLKELETRELTNKTKIQNLQQEFDEYKLVCETEQNALMEKVDSAYQSQMQAEKTSQETLNELQSFIIEKEKSENNMIDVGTQTRPQDIFENLTSSPEDTNPVDELSNDHSSSHSKDIDEETDSFQSLPQRLSVEIKSQEIGRMKSRRSSQLSKKRTSKDDGDDYQSMINENEPEETSINSYRGSSIGAQKTTKKELKIDQIKSSFFHLYEIIYKFRHLIVNLLEHNEFSSFADILQMTQQLSSNDNSEPNDYIENSECVLKDIVKVLQTCITTLLSRIKEYRLKESAVKTDLDSIIEISSTDDQQSSTIQDKEFLILDLKNKYENTTKLLNETNKNHEKRLKEDDDIILDQQKLIRTLQLQVTHVQQRLDKIEENGIVEPSILFTRLDIERNEQLLQKAVQKGKVTETTYNELNEAMTKYTSLPSQQFSNLVKRYIHFRRAVELETRIKSYANDNQTKTALKKMESLHELRSNQIARRMALIRQQRAHLAKTLTENFDHVEDESSIFLIRPIYSCQGRTATQSYMRHVKRRRDGLFDDNSTRSQHHPSRQSSQTQYTKNQKDESQHVPARLSSVNASEDDETYFNIEKSFTSFTPIPAPNGQQSDSASNITEIEKKSTQNSEISRLQELDIHRSLIPVSHVSTPLLSAFTNSGIDPWVPSLNLRSYVAVHRPGIGNIGAGKSNETVSRISREGVSTVSAKSHERNLRTPFNSVAGDIKRGSTPLPPIKRPLAMNMPSTINEKQHGGFIPSLNTNEVSTTT